jgi:hypothetical protein
VSAAIGTKDAAVGALARERVAHPARRVCGVPFAARNQVQMAMEDGLRVHFAAVDAGNPAQFAAEPGALRHLVRAIPAVERLPLFWSRATSMSG